MALHGWAFADWPVDEAVCLDVLVLRSRRLLVLFHCSSFQTPDQSGVFAH
jgi:hypothetical protein